MPPHSFRFPFAPITPVLCLALCLSLLAPPPAWPTTSDLDRQIDEFVQVMEGLPARGFEFTAWINDGDQAILEVGDTIAFRIKSDRSTHVSFVYLDQDGVVSLPVPIEPPGSGLIEDESWVHELACARIRPLGRVDAPVDEPCSFEATFPLGFDLVWAIATPEPLRPERLGQGWESSEGLPRLPAAEGPTFARALIGKLAGYSPGQVSWVEFEQAVLDIGASSLTDFSGYLSQRATRSADTQRRYRAPSVFFAVASADLDDRARRALRVIANYMLQAEHATASIRLIGHTDATGSAPANEALSERRALAVRTHLESLGLARERLEIVARGERDPLSSDHRASSSANQRNRRVELEIYSRPVPGPGTEPGSLPGP